METQRHCTAGAVGPYAPLDDQATATSSAASMRCFTQQGNRRIAETYPIALTFRGIETLSLQLQQIYRNVTKDTNISKLK